MYIYIYVRYSNIYIYIYIYVSYSNIYIYICKVFKKNYIKIFDVLTGLNFFIS